MQIMVDGHYMGVNFFSNGGHIVSNSSTRARGQEFMCWWDLKQQLEEVCIGQ
jgi:hypothetical protein